MSETQKHTKPNVPNLRFPGFEGEWEERRLGECCSGFDYGMNAASKSYDGVNGYIRITDIDEHTNEFRKEGIVSPDAVIDEIYRVRENDILFARTGASTGKTYIYKSQDGRLYFAGFLIRANVFNWADSRFVFYQTQIKRYAKWVQIMSMRSGQPGINSQEYASFQVNLPELNEQKKVASFIALLDQRISLQIKLIDHYESLIRAIILRSQSSTSRRKVYLHEILNERKELNEQGYDICSVSVSKGVVNQVEYLGRSFAAKETAHYHVVHKGDIVYTKSPTGEFPYGIIKQSYLDAPVAVSPLYGVYEPIDYLTGVYLHHFFCSPQNAKNYLHKLIQKGAKNTINITNQHFLDNYISIPESDTLQSTVAIIETLSKRVDLEKEFLSLFIEQKAYLMSNMFI